MAVGIGLIGAGHMGRSVAGQVVAGADDLQIREIFDPDPGSVRESRTSFGDAFLEAASVDDLLANKDINWVMIASWNCFHAEQVIAAFTAGKHVFCQKPLATNLADCLAMRDAWRQSGRRFVIGFNLRYSPHYRRLQSLIESGYLGDIISFEFNETLDFNHGGFIHGDWRRHVEYAGSHLLEKCCHDIDLANWLIGSRAERVASFGGLDFFIPENSDELDRVGKTRSGRQGFMTWRDGKTENPFTADKDILDNQVVILEYANGVRASLHLNASTALPERRMYICGTRGTLRADLYRGEIYGRRIGFGTTVEDLSTVGDGMHGGGDAVLASELVATMRRGEPTSTSFEAGLESAVTCFAIDDAERSGEVVSLKDYWAQVDADPED